jgi:hypothetical protein
MFKTQSAAGLLASAVGVLIALAVPASVHNPSYGAGTSPASRFGEAGFGSLHAVSSERLMRPMPSPTTALGSRSFHSVDRTTSPGTLSGGALGMVLLGLFSIALFVAALLFRGPQPRKDR